ncbi:hypothetical protein M9Y10_041582 [Tritrichomonas musculus]|uniref:Uncharacterized protein n=1 Tax=Tritrichomonas musculus TaxID=1915356 RepID=A0ABR2K5C6_9EUKA
MSEQEYALYIIEKNAESDAATTAPYKKFRQIQEDTGRMHVHAKPADCYGAFLLREKSPPFQKERTDQHDVGH